MLARGRILENLAVWKNALVTANTFEALCKNNPQLKRLKIQPEDSVHFYQSISTHLCHLQKLTIEGYGITAQRLSHFKVMEQLTKLKMLNLKAEYFNEILAVIGEMKQLTQVELDAMKRTAICQSICEYSEPFLVMARNLRELKIIHMRGVKLPENVLLEFIRNASNLELFQIVQCDIEITENLFGKLIDARSQANKNAIKCNALTISSDKILNFWANCS